MPSGRRRAFGFSLIELIVVMTVTLVLTGLLLPALVQVRENAHRVICSSNLRQIGLATVMYADGENGRLPPSEFALPGGSKQEMMAVHRGGAPENWEGLGWLHAREYFKGPQVLYCPSHVGDHTFQRYQQQYSPVLRPPLRSVPTNDQMWDGSTPTITTPDPTTGNAKPRVASTDGW